MTPHKEEFFSEEKNQKTFALAPAETFAAKVDIILLVLLFRMEYSPLRSH
jgi:hypothetical protein